MGVASASFWEGVEYWAMAGVTLGVIGEFVADFTRLSKSTRWKRSIEKWSALLLIVALLIELAATVKTNNISSLAGANLNLRAQQATEAAARLGVKTDTLTALVIQKTTEADSAIKNLQSASDRASAAIAQANAQVRNVAGEAQKLQQAAGRHVTPEQKRTLKKLLQGSHIEVRLGSDSLPEPIGYRDELIDALQQAGVKVIEKFENVCLGSCPRGITLRAYRNDPNAVLLLRAMNAAALPNLVVLPGDMPSQISIKVNMNPYIP